MKNKILKLVFYTALDQDEKGACIFYSDGTYKLISYEEGIDICEEIVEQENIKTHQDLENIIDSGVLIEVMSKEQLYKLINKKLSRQDINKVVDSRINALKLGQKQLKPVIGNDQLKIAREIINNPNSTKEERDWAIEVIDNDFMANKGPKEVGTMNGINGFHHAPASMKGASTEETSVFNSLPIFKGENVEESEQPKRPQTPSKGQNPGQPEIPLTPSRGQNPKQPEIPLTPSRGQNPKQPEIPLTPSKGQNPGQPEIPLTPSRGQNSKQPEKPQTPSKGQNPKQPEIPQTPSEGKNPEQSEIPQTPSEGKNPEQPKRPQTPSEGKNPEQPKRPQTPSEGKNPEQPEVDDDDHDFFPEVEDNKLNPNKNDEIKEMDRYKGLGGFFRKIWDKFKQSRIGIKLTAIGLAILTVLGLGYNCSRKSLTGEIKDNNINTEPTTTLLPNPETLQPPTATKESLQGRKEDQQTYTNNNSDDIKQFTIIEDDKAETETNHSHNEDNSSDLGSYLSFTTNDPDFLSTSNYTFAGYDEKGNPIIEENSTSLDPQYQEVQVEDLTADGTGAYAPLPVLNGEDLELEPVSYDSENYGDVTTDGTGAYEPLPDPQKSGAEFDATSNEAKVAASNEAEVDAYIKYLANANSQETSEGYRPYVKAL